MELNDSGMNNCADEILHFLLHFCTMGIMMATTGVLFKNALTTAIGTINRICASAALLGRPQRLAHVIVQRARVGDSRRHDEQTRHREQPFIRKPAQTVLNPHDPRRELHRERTEHQHVRARDVFQQGCKHDHDDRDAVHRLPRLPRHDCRARIDQRRVFVPRTIASGATRALARHTRAVSPRIKKSHRAPPRHRSMRASDARDFLARDFLARASDDASDDDRDSNMPSERSRAVTDHDDDEKIAFETSRGIESKPTFDAMGIREDLLRGLYSYGFEKPSAIQQRAVVPIISGRDVIAQAQKGTGKTSMISLALCQITSVAREVQGLVLSPTRELAVQTEKTALALGNFMNVQTHACIGGRSIGEDIRKLDHGCHM